MTAGEMINLLPTKWRHEAAILLLGGVIAWGMFSFNSRLEAAEKKADSVVTIQNDVQMIKTSQAVSDQRVVDIADNVREITAALLGPEAVVHHAPAAPPAPSPPKKK